MSWPGRLRQDIKSCPGCSGQDVPSQTSDGLCVLSQTSWPGHLCPIVLLPLLIGVQKQFLDKRIKFIFGKDKCMYRGSEKKYFGNAYFTEINPRVVSNRYNL